MHLHPPDKDVLKLVRVDLVVTFCFGHAVVKPLVQLGHRVGGGEQVTVAVGKVAARARI